MNREEDPELWDLLGRAQTLQPSPFFARNVLREIRDIPVRFSWWERVRGRRVLIPTFAAAAALLITVAVMRYQPHRSLATVASSTEQPVDRTPAAAVAPEPEISNAVASTEGASQPATVEEAAVTPVNVQADEPLVVDFKLLAEADDDSDDDAALLL
ncbi:MAG: hypothetical protein ABI839_07070 [Verrucomicrobiota bacterium]